MWLRNTCWQRLWSFILFGALASTACGAAEAPNPISLPQARAQLAGLSVPFVANHGQLDPRVAFYARTFAGTVFITEDGDLALSLPAPGRDKPGWTLVEKPVRGSPRPWAEHPRGADPALARVSVFQGNDPSRWQRGLASYQHVDVGTPWKGVSLSYAAHGDNVERLFTLAPGASAAAIDMQVSGAKTLAIADGALTIKTGLGDVTLTKPRAYQLDAQGHEQDVAVRYVLHGREYGFKLGRHDGARPVVIDPLVQATYLGGSFGDLINASALDSSGNLYVVGHTSSTNFPGTTGGFQTHFNGASRDMAFVAWLSADLKTLKQATYLGGTTNDQGFAIAVSTSAVYIAGLTNSTDLPMTTGGAQAANNAPTNGNGFIAEFSQDLTTLLQSTYLGGSTSDSITGIILGSAGQVYVSGATQSTDLPGVTHGAQATYGGGGDVFVAELSGDLKTLMQSTYLGGNLEDDPGITAFTSSCTGGVLESRMAVGTSGQVYVAGATLSTNFPVTSGGAQASNRNSLDTGFVAELSGDLKTLMQATYLGGSTCDAVSALAVGSAGQVYATGMTESNDFPGVAGGAQATKPGSGVNGFVAELSGDLKTLQQATYVGGNGTDTPSDLAIGSVGTASGQVYLTGFTSSTNFPGIAGGSQTSNNASNTCGTTTGFVAEVSAGLTAVTQATYLGGSGCDQAATIALGASGQVYVVGTATSTDFPGTAGAAQSSIGGGRDGFIAELSGDLRASAVAPSANTGSLNVNENTGGTGTLSGSPGTVGDTLTFSISLAASHGTATITNASTGAFSYTPTTGYAGSDHFNFQVTDNQNGLNATASENITVAAPPSPTVHNGQLTMNANSTGNGTLNGAPGVVGDTLTFKILTPPTQGTLTLTNAATGAFSYTPPIGYADATVQFQFYAVDNQNGESSSPTIELVFMNPLANAGSLSVNANGSGAGTLSVTNSGGETFTFSVVSPPGHGAVTITNAATGAFSYTPTKGYSGSDSFGFSVIDSHGHTSNTAVETLTVVPPTHPTASSGSVTASENAGGTGTLSGAVGNVGDTLTFSVVAQPGHGIVSITNVSTGAFSYTPAAGYSGTDSFTFIVTDNQNGLSSSSATESITVSAPASHGSSGGGGGGSLGLVELLLLGLLGRSSRRPRNPCSPRLWPLALFGALASAACGAAEVPNSISLPQARAQLAGLSEPFVANQGQLDPRVAFYAQTFAGTVFITEDGDLALSLPAPGRDKPGWTLVEKPVRGSPRPRAEHPHGQDPALARVSVFHGNDPSRWQRGLETYGRVDVGQPWKGIDLAYSAYGNNVERLFTLAPGANADVIRMDVSGAKQLALVGGALSIKTGLGDLSLSKPRAYQLDALGHQQDVPVRYVLHGKDYGFKLGRHDSVRPVVIDPLIQATYLGGSSNDQIQGIALDPSGDVYVVGLTGSMDFPGTTGGAQTNFTGGTSYNNAFVAELSGDLRTLKQATYLAGTLNFSAANQVAIGSTGIYVAGTTGTSNFPGTTGGAQATNNAGVNGNFFIAKLSADLKTLIQSTYLGGSSGEGTSAAGLVIGAAGQLYVTGETLDSSFPGTAGGAQASNGGGTGTSDCFVAELSGDLKTLMQATYLGGSGNDYCNGIASGPAGQLYAIGSTSSANFPATAGGAQTGNSGLDIFVAELSGDLKTLGQASYLGTGNHNFPGTVAVDSAGDIYVSGHTTATDFPGTSGGAQATNNAGSNGSVVVARLSADLKTLVQSTYLGGTGTQFPAALLVASTGPEAGQIYVVGSTTSTDFPGTASAIQSTNGSSGYNIFVALLTGDLKTLTQATYLSGTGSANNTALAAVLGSSGQVYVAGETFAADFPGTAGGAQSACADSGGCGASAFGGDGVIAELSADLKAVIAPAASAGSLTVNENASGSGILSGTAGNGGDTLTFSIVTQPSHGTVSITNAATGAFSYAPTAGYSGGDSFTFMVTDNQSSLSSSNATESITVNAVSSGSSGGGGGKASAGGGGGSLGLLELLLLGLLGRRSRRH